MGESKRRAIAILGGSSAFTPALAAALATRAAEVPPLEIRLHGRSRARLDGVAAFCNRHAADRGADHTYTATTAVAEAARDATIVVNQIRVGGWCGRIHDDTFPLAFDLPGDETLGPGGLASAIRAMPTIRDAADTVRAVAPDTWFLNMSNPLDVLLIALEPIAGPRLFGLCELPRVTLEHALARVGETPTTASWDYLGVNHQAWFTRIERDGTDLLPAIADAIEAAPEGYPIDADRIRVHGALPLPYLRLHEHRAREVRRQRARPTPRGADLARLSERLHARYAEPERVALPPELADRATPWVEDAAATVLALLGGEPTERWVSRAIDGRPREARVRIDANGPAAAPDDTAVRARRPALAAHTDRVIEYERAAAACALDPTPARVADALRLDPFAIDEARVAALIEPVLHSVAEVQR